MVCADYPNGGIKIYKFKDINGNGVQDNGEGGMSAVFKIVGDNGWSTSVSTDSYGKTNPEVIYVPFGAVYTITETVASGYYATTQNPQTVWIKEVLASQCPYTACARNVNLKFGNSPKQTTTTTIATTTTKATTTTCRTTTTMPTTTTCPTTTTTTHATTTTTSTSSTTTTLCGNLKVFKFNDYNGNGVWEGPAVDTKYIFGLAGDIPVVGDWNGDGRTKIGVFRNGIWYLDFNGNRVSGRLRPAT